MRFNVERIVLAMVLLLMNRPGFAVQAISALWANEGGDKIAREELRASQGTAVLNSTWDGQKIVLFGGRNEVVGFNLVLEAASQEARGVTVSFNTLNGPSGAVIASAPAAKNLFDWKSRDIELFYVRYLQIQGLSLVANETYDERLIPRRMRRSWNHRGVGSGSWKDRPDHDKHYPDIAVPLELVPSFTIAAGQNQSIWADIYIPKTVPPGTYTGTLTVHENGVSAGKVPVQLEVYAFTLPDSPSAKTMVVYSPPNIHRRYIGVPSSQPDAAEEARDRLIRDRHYLLAHRHRISLIGDAPRDCRSKADEPCPESLPRLDGSLFTADHGYKGPGVLVGNDVYSIGTYGAWPWRKGTEADMHRHTDAWATWFKTFSPQTEYFLYLIDESKDTAQIETWARWILNNPGPGRELKSLATLPLPKAAAEAPSLDIPASTVGAAVPSRWQPLVNRYTQDPRKRFFMYNGHRPGSGSFAIEDDGVALRELAWGQYKKKINRWFYWHSTYYNNYQGGRRESPVFQNAQTFGYSTKTDGVLGQTGWNYGNGDGILFYPGTDTVFPEDSYGVDGPLASLRLKYWRRGIQDVDYLTMAAAIDPKAVETIVNQIVPKVLWEYGVTNPLDPSYIRTEISWPTDPDAWEKARAQLAQIIDGKAAQ